MFGVTDCKIGYSLLSGKFVLALLYVVVHFEIGSHNRCDWNVFGNILAKNISGSGIRNRTLCTANKILDPISFDIFQDDVIYLLWQNWICGNWGIWYKLE